MDLDASCLRWAKVENLERLARALRVSLPAQKRQTREAYHRALVRLVVRAMQDDARRHGRVDSFMHATYS